MNVTKISQQELHSDNPLDADKNTIPLSHKFDFLRYHCSLLLIVDEEVD